MQKVVGSNPISRFYSVSTSTRDRWRQSASREPFEWRRMGNSSGVPVDGPLAYLVTLRDGKVTASGLFGDGTEALEAAGLEE